MTGYLSALTRPELDELIGHAEHGNRIAQIVFTNCPLVLETVQGACGVAGDCLALCNDVYEESIRRMTLELAVHDG